MKKQRLTAADWEARVREWERSGLSGVEFARRMGVSPGVLYAWKHRLRRKPAAAKVPAVRKAARFVEVEVVATERRTESAAVEIVLGNGRVVRVTGGVEVLAAVLRAAEDAC